MDKNTAEFCNLSLLQVNVTRCFYLLVSNGLRHSAKRNETKQNEK